jgi:putative flippase GtrA
VKNKKEYTQFFRYAAVGVLSNVILYVLYLLITYFGASAKCAMTITYSIGVAQSFLLNKNWTFNYKGRVGSAFFRYFIIYAFGYFINFIALYIFVDLMMWPHKIVQAGMILIVAAVLFCLQKAWVFRKH